MLDTVYYCYYTSIINKYRFSLKVQIYSGKEQAEFNEFTNPQSALTASPLKIYWILIPRDLHERGKLNTNIMTCKFSPGRSEWTLSWVERLPLFSLNLERWCIFSHKVWIDFFSRSRKLVLRNKYLSLSTITNFQGYYCCFHGIKEDLTSADLCGPLWRAPVASYYCLYVFTWLEG